MTLKAFSMELSNNKWGFYANCAVLCRLALPHFDFYWQWRPHKTTKNVRMRVNMEIILSICILQVFLISINFSFLTWQTKSWWGWRKEENWTLSRPKTARTAFTPSGFLRYRRQPTENKKENIFEHSSLSLLPPSCRPAHVQNFSLPDFCCANLRVHTKKKVNAHMRNV